MTYTHGLGALSRSAPMSLPRGEKVRELQDKMIAAGKLTGGADGISGPRLAAAVQSIATEQGLPANSVTSMDTIGALVLPTALYRFILTMPMAVPPETTPTAVSTAVSAETVVRSGPSPVLIVGGVAAVAALGGAVWWLKFRKKKTAANRRRR